MADTKVLEAFILEAKRLRACAAEAEADFFRFLMDGERNEAMWRGDPGAKTGFTTFCELLNGADICRPHRYVRFKVAVERFGWDVVRSIGVEAATQVLPVPVGAASRTGSAEAPEAIVNDMQAFRERNNTVPSRQQARAIVRKHYDPPPQKDEEAPSFDDRVKELEHENAQLKKALAAKDREIAKLKKELDAARASALQPTPRARRAKAAPAQATA